MIGLFRYMIGPFRQALTVENFWQRRLGNVWSPALVLLLRSLFASLLAPRQKGVGGGVSTGMGVGEDGGGAKGGGREGAAGGVGGCEVYMLMLELLLEEILLEKKGAGGGVTLQCDINAPDVDGRCVCVCLVGEGACVGGGVSMGGVCGGGGRVHVRQKV
jgi:hypothetical protein